MVNRQLPVANPMAPLSRLLNSTLTVADIVSTPLWSVPASMAVDDAVRAMTNRNFDIGGVSPDPPHLFVDRTKLAEVVDMGYGSEPVERHAVNIPASQCVEKSLPIAMLLEAFETHERLFVLDGNSVRWVITHADLVAPAVSVAVLSFLAIIESGLKHLGSDLSDEQLKSLLNSKRLIRAQNLYAKLVVCNAETAFRDCFYFEDWLTITAKIRKTRLEVGFSSRTAFENATGFLGSVRDDLAHGRSLLNDSRRSIPEVLARVRQIREFSVAVWQAVERRRPIWDAYATTVISTIGPNVVTLTGSEAISPWPFDHRVFVVTAWNPGSVWMSGEKNREANQRLFESLILRGGSATPVVGHSIDREWSEESFLVEGLQGVQIAELAALFGQVAYFELDDTTLNVCDSSTMDVVRSVDRIST